jgi:hypothetical protein
MAKPLIHVAAASLLVALLGCLAAPVQAEVRWSVSIGSHYGHWAPHGWVYPRSYRHTRHLWGPSLWYAAPAVTYVMVAPPQPVQIDPIIPGLQSTNPPTNTTPVASGELILDAQSGQTAMQTQRDRSACMQQASKQPQANDAAVFRDALATCLQERGYAAR